MNYLKKLFCAVLLIGSYVSCTNSIQKNVNVLPHPKYNVLFVIVDDLRPELGCYGKTNIFSPEIDKFSKSALVFNKAYCQQAVCSPSRTSVLTGLRPDSTRIYDLETHFRTTIPHVVTLPQYFKQNGYYTIGLGKIFHQDFGFSPLGLEDAPSWSVPVWNPDVNSGRGYVLEENLQIAKNNKGRGPAIEIADVPDNKYKDGMIADSAVQLLRKLKDKPFFLAVGFHKPHLPFTAPKKYWNLYNHNNIIIPDTSLPQNAPKFALSDFGELRAYDGIPKKGPLSQNQAAELIHGYYASVSYMDAQFGRVMNELKKLDLEKNTIVVFWGDHGWKLGEYNNWCKHDNFEIDTRSPLIISTPEMRAKGKTTNSIVEFIDIYPTICDEAGLPLPAHLQGKSFSSLLQFPDRKFKDAALSQYPRNDIMGYSLRTQRYRFTSWQRNSDPAQEVAVELYDHQKDPEEKKNVASEAEYTNTIVSLRKILSKIRGENVIKKSYTLNGVKKYNQ
jgi:arylsulfatase A-like enzyme